MKYPYNTPGRKNYAELYNTCSVKDSKVEYAAKIAKKIIANKLRYESLSAITGVPAHVIAAIHNMECSLSFKKHLHNGNTLKRRTTWVPKGRPKEAPLGADGSFTWEQSAIDALEYDGLIKWSDWSVPGTLYKMERYNGWGYARKKKNSPYLWSFTDKYRKGKYVADGKYDPNAVSKQLGIAALFKQLETEGWDIFPNGPVLIKELTTDYPGYIFKRGKRNNRHVELIQERLNKLSMHPAGSPLVVDGDFGPATQNAVRLFQARAADSKGNSLVIDGVVGSITWQALFGKRSVPVVTPAGSNRPILEEVINVARGEIGVMEEPLGSNRGPKVSQYLRAAGAGVPNPWCAAFVYWCFKKASANLGINNPAIKSAGVLNTWDRADKKDIRCISSSEATADPSLILPGMVFIIDTGTPGGAGHTGLVEKLDGGTLVTIEGNTNDGGSREGIGVFRRKARKINSINVGFIDYSEPDSVVE